MRVLVDVKCNRCGCTASGMWVEPMVIVAGHTCPDGGLSESFLTTERVVPGPGEHGRDREES